MVQRNKLKNARGLMKQKLANELELAPDGQLRCHAIICTQQKQLEPNAIMVFAPSVQSIHTCMNAGSQPGSSHAFAW